MALPLLVLGLPAAFNLAESFVDNVIRDKVTPKLGSILYCRLYGPTTHTGIYVGENQIVELLGTGKVKLSTPKEFISGTQAMSIYVSCKGTQAVGFAKAAQRARAMVGKTLDYPSGGIPTEKHERNCHCFVYECLSGEHDSGKWTLLDIEAKFRGEFFDNWRVWDLDSKDLF
ncbi:C40 family peptidase [Helicobacter bizzozeronii]|uniref:YiiX/YebB-like N1pC/P60 family cysteine hydrolase n=1 Tax=Helicobacter bizzozeronii TaxID=56877 RepID=UPI00024E5F0E|nr:YiiX/YebB-like N1pC/P60 family cysteine hydrolase [Helicobacter bizzozeronii]CCF81851.1 hypothetical protein HBZS_123020 [Helicobacter bizzozeronii CCUG 35545]